MSVCASIDCSTCGESGPGVGDGGAIGFPSLKDVSLIEGEYASFEHIYRGYLAVGLRLRELDVIRAWLVRHVGHKVGLRFEGEDAGRRTLPRPEPGGYAFELPDSSQFDEGAYSRTFVEGKCDRCELTERIGPVHVLPFSLDLSPERARAFASRVLLLDNHNFYRTFGLLDPNSPPTDAFFRFIDAHRQHKARLRTVDDEQISVRTLPKAPVRTTRSYEVGDVLAGDLSFPPPLRIAWTRELPIGHPLVHEGCLYGYLGRRDVMAALDLDGSEIWRSEPLGEARDIPRFAGSQIYLQGGSPSRGNSDMVILDRESGATVSRVPLGFYLQEVLSDGRLIGLQIESGSNAIGLYESDGTAAWRVIEPAYKTSSRGGIGQASHRFGSTLLVDRRTGVAALDLATGREVWFTEMGLRFLVDRRESFLLQDGTLVVQGPGVSAVKAETGELLWRDETAWGRMAVSDRLVVCVETTMSFEPTRRVHARSLGDGTAVFDNRLDTEAWRRLPPPLPRLSTAPILIGGHIYVCDGARLYCLSAETGDPLWMRSLPKGSGAMLIACDRMFIGNGQHLTVLEPVDPDLPVR